jgi:hypothetical protein
VNCSAAPLLLCAYTRILAVIGPPTGERVFLKKITTTDEYERDAVPGDK